MGTRVRDLSIGRVGGWVDEQVVGGGGGGHGVEGALHLLRGEGGSGGHGAHADGGRARHLRAVAVVGVYGEGEGAAEVGQPGPRVGVHVGGVGGPDDGRRVGQHVDVDALGRAGGGAAGRRRGGDRVEAGGLGALGNGGEAGHVGPFLARHGRPAERHRARRRRAVPAVPARRARPPQHALRRRRRGGIARDAVVGRLAGAAGRGRIAARRRVLRAVAGAVDALRARDQRNASADSGQLKVAGQATDGEAQGDALRRCVCDDGYRLHGEADISHVTRLSEGGVEYPRVSRFNGRQWARDALVHQGHHDLDRRRGVVRARRRHRSRGCSRDLYDNVVQPGRETGQTAVSAAVTDREISAAHPRGIESRPRQECDSPRNRIILKVGQIARTYRASPWSANISSEAPHCWHGRLYRWLTASWIIVISQNIEGRVRIKWTLPLAN